MNTQKEKTPLWKKIGVGFLALAAVGYFMPSNGSGSEAGSSLTASESLVKCYVASTRVLKNGLKDPESFEEINHTKSFIEPGSNNDSTKIQVVINYRAKNSFGGYVVDKQAFNFNKSLSLIDSYKLGE